MDPNCAELPYQWCTSKKEGVAGVRGEAQGIAGSTVGANQMTVVQMIETVEGVTKLREHTK